MQPRVKKLKPPGHLRLKKPTRKKIKTGIKTANRNDKIAVKRSNATSSREELVSQLRQDLKAAKEFFKSAQMNAQNGLKLAKKAAKDEIAVVRFITKLEDQVFDL
jgi:hypothetical protein